MADGNITITPSSYNYIASITYASPAEGADPRITFSIQSQEPGSDLPGTENWAAECFMKSQLPSAGPLPWIYGSNPSRNFGTCPVETPLSIEMTCYIFDPTGLAYVTATFACPS